MSGKQPLSDELGKCATLAIKDYNSQTESNYQFVQIENVTWQLVGGVRYYITFQAKNAEEECKTFLAAVFITLKVNLKVIEVEGIKMKGSSTW